MNSHPNDGPRHAFPAQAYTTDTTARTHILTSESVTEGHPDKLCDQVSDAILDALLAQDPDSRAAIECLATTGLLLICGEVRTNAVVDYASVARDTLRDIGYTDAQLGIGADTAGVLVAVHGQSPDIAQGVDAISNSEHEQGAGDQGMMYGYATNETPELMPLPITLAHALTRRLAHVRKKGIIPYLGPDGKAQVSVEYHGARPVRVSAVVLSSQHSETISIEHVRADLRHHVINPILTAWIDATTVFHINPTGKFVVGGPHGDTGLTGRKIIVDTYGGIGRHGGGAFSGKDSSKVDRSAAYAARWVAKNVVAAGLAQRCEVQISYAIGIAQPTSIHLETFGTNTIPEDEIERRVLKTFDLRPTAIIKALDLKLPRYKLTAAYGHFGRTDIDAPWERTNRAQALRVAT